jgi:peroxiredoxin Q/BCP
MLKLNSPAPNFSLPDQTGKIHTLNQYHGQWVVLYFYPKDDTPGCTIEANNFRDHLQIFAEHNVVILGVSKDSVKSHDKFATKFTLNFPLLSDPSTDIIKAYGAWGPKKFMGKEFNSTLRTTILINPEGKIAKIYEHVNPTAHVEEILKDIQNFQSSKD